MSPIDSEKDVLTVLEALKISNSPERFEMMIDQAKIKVRNKDGTINDIKTLEHLINGDIIAYFESIYPKISTSEMEKFLKEKL